ncbi:MAG TPA: thioredoxin family protein [Dehalococcoidia bacterium]|nr:thioredoxin family protein [Dehalococcoidia bacterium]
MSDADLFSSLMRRALDRRAFLRGAAGAGAGGAALIAFGCGASSSPKATPSAVASGTPAPGGTGAAGALHPALLTQEFVAGQDNRFSVGLLDGAGKLVKNAAVHLRFYTIGADGKTGTFRGEGDATFVELNVPGAHTHDSSPGSAVADDSVAFYVAHTPFDVAGKWGVEIDVKPDNGGAPEEVQVPFDVLDKSQSPGIGTVPPASHNDTTATNHNPASLCSRVPVCPLHDKVIADVLGKGRPLVVQFSTPAFCATRFCGPVLEVALTQVPQYQDRVDFVHIEIWQDHQLQQYRPAVKEWNLPGEPYTFFMGKDGKVAGRLEAIFSDEELSSALKQLVAL